MPYNLSTDYPALYSMLLAGEEVACFVDYIRPGELLKNDIAKIIRKAPWRIEIGSRGMQYGCVSYDYKDGVTELETFVHQCTRLNLQYIPQIDIKQVAVDAWDAALEWNSVEEIPKVKFGYKKNHVEDKEQYLTTLLKDKGLG